MKNLLPLVLLLMTVPGRAVVAQEGETRATAVVDANPDTGAHYVLLSPPRTFAEPPTYIVDERGLSGVTDEDGGVTRTVLAITSLDAWNGVLEEPVLFAEPGSVASFALGDGIPMIVFADPLRVCTGNCLAATFTGFYSEVSEGHYQVQDADIVINVRQPWASEGEDHCSSEFLVEGVMVHEVGHGLGLGHSFVSGATMEPTTSSCSNSQATTEIDDRAGLLALLGVDCLAGAGCAPGDTCAPAGASCCCIRGGVAFHNSCVGGTWTAAARCPNGQPCDNTGPGGRCAAVMGNISGL